MRVLLTGGTGFLGKHVCQHFVDAGYRVTHGRSPLDWPDGMTVWAPSSKDLNLLDESETRRMVTRYEPHVIVHLAAKMGGILANQTFPADFLHDNLDMTSHIFRAAEQAGTPWVYTAGSVCAYPKHCPVPFTEDNLWNGYPEETNAGYGASKRISLMLQQAYRQQFGVKGAHFLIVNLYGDYDSFDLRYSHVIPALIRKCLHAKRLGIPKVEVWGSGLATREFLYAGDCGRALVMAVEQELDCVEPINLGCGTDISIKDLAEMIKQLTGYDGQMVFNGGLNGQPKRLLDVSRAKKLFDFTATTSFQEGLRKTLDYYLSNQEEIDKLDK
jgi:GDP-L-fucose synthase